jgi:hypothetical protein
MYYRRVTDHVEKATIRSPHCATLLIPGLEKSPLKTQHGTALPEKLTIPRLVRKFPAL